MYIESYVMVGPWWLNKKITNALVLLENIVCDSELFLSIII